LSQERICINGLWRWQPANDESLPTNRWGYFKVPGSWPGITDYMQKDSQMLYAHESWKSVSLGNITTAWYQREVVIPTNWVERRIVLSTEYLNSHAVVYVDGKRVGEIRFPG
jgi:beta-galactosidase/beta-glucuronidase